MTIARVAGLLHRTIGLDAASIGTSAIERAVQTRLSVGKIPNIDAYWELASSSNVELQRLIEEVIVPETWFFRDREAFVALAQLAGEDWSDDPPAAPRRLLSVPCSTGEEPFSMAMALLDAGLAPESFRIDAIDVSGRVLSGARDALYGRNSFRGADLAFRDHYFEPAGGEYRLAATVRRQVEFRQGNLLSGEALPGVPTYDVVFCRNLLIYFDVATQDQAVRNLRALLAPGAVLFVGPSESAPLLRHGFVSMKRALASAFRDPARREPQRSLAMTATPQAAQASHAQPRARCAQLRDPPRGRAPVPDSDLTTAATLADQGRLAEAAGACERHLREHVDSVPALHLMGLIHAAMDDLASATQFFRKALYLDPNHLDTLLHLGLLLEKQGDGAAARLLRERMQRATHGAPS